MEDLVYMGWVQLSRGGKDDTLTDDVSSTIDPEATRLISTELSKEKVDRGKDNIQTDKYMSLHHIATAVLCLGSWALNFTRIGSIVMFLHDISDVPLDFARLFGRYSWYILHAGFVVI